MFSKFLISSINTDLFIKQDKKINPTQTNNTEMEYIFIDNTSNSHIVFDVLIGLVVASNDQTLCFVPLLNLWMESESNSFIKAPHLCPFC